MRKNIHDFWLNKCFKHVDSDITPIIFNKYSEVKCPHCDKIGKSGVMRRWHFDNCKKL